MSEAGSGIRWKTLADEQQVYKALSANLSIGATPDRVKRFAGLQKMEVSDVIDDVVYASAPAKSAHPFIKAKWLVQFHFDRDHRLDEIRVRRGLIGP